MEKVNFKCSNKNISIRSERVYILETFITRMRWKAINFNSKTNDNSSERYALKTLKYLLQVKDLVLLRNDLTDILKVIRFRKIKN